MYKKKETFVIPEAEVIIFSDDDIITLSDGGAKDPGFGDEEF